MAIAACVLLAVLGLLAWYAWDRGVPELVKRSDPGAAKSDRPDQVELCGYGNTKPIRETIDYPPEVIKAAEKTLASVADNLSAQAQPTTRAIGLYAKLVAAMRRAGDEEQRLTPNCTDEQCMQRRWKVARQAAGPHAEELARLAVTSQDPGAYAMALFGCRLNSEDGPCAQLSVARWSQLDADNAVPWFYLAEDAARRKDEAALNESLRRAAHAKTSDYQWSTILAMAEHPAARDLATAPRLVYLTQLLGIYAAFPAPPYLAVSNACTTDRMADPARRQVCADLATMMTERSKSLLELSIGTSIGERAGWPADRVQRLRDEKDASFFVGRNNWVSEDVHSCRFLKQLEVRTKELLSLGELLSARQKIAVSDRSAAAMAQEWRELQRQLNEAQNKGAAPK